MHPLRRLHARMDAFLERERALRPERTEESLAAARAGWIPTLRLAWWRLRGRWPF